MTQQRKMTHLKIVVCENDREAIERFREHRDLHSEETWTHNSVRRESSNGHRTVCWKFLSDNLYYQLQGREAVIVTTRRADDLMDCRVTRYRDLAGLMGRMNSKYEHS